MGSDREFHKRLLADALSERFGLSLIEGDAAGAEAAVREAFDEELPYAVIHDAVVAPAMHKIGALWERGEIGVAHEHLATQISLRTLALLRELFRVVRRRAEHRIMLAALPGEQHIMALQMASDLLEDAGYDTVMLGPDVPTGALREIVAEHKPQLVAVTATMQQSGARLTDAIDAVLDVSPATGLIAGGAAGRRRVADPHEVAFARTVVDVVDLADAMVRRPDLN